MIDIAIRVEKLSKRYRIGRAQQRHDTLRDALVAGLRAPLERLRRDGRGLDRPAEDTIWALKDVSFEVKCGEVLGIIGRNGAGKSTLLKILSRITEPTEGRAVIDGRVGSLLEVGTGFHPELTGRENIYLNGAILGMRRAEIDRRFDGIVAFAEIERFLDTPVKHYSSGMYVRLAFAVAAHLEPEIMLVDEVLAVGDIAFQKKCLGKMSNVARGGRTILFVSHNMAAIANLCTHAFLLEQGRITRMGNTQDVIEAYIRSFQSLNGATLDQREDREGSGRLRFEDMRIQDRLGRLLDVVTCGQDVTFELAYTTDTSIRSQNVVMSIGFYNILGQPLFLCRSDLQGTEYRNMPAQGTVSCHIPKLPLPPGEFRVNLQCEVNGVVADWLRDAYIVTVIEGDFFGSGRLPSRTRGDLLIEHQWRQPVADAKE